MADANSGDRLEVNDLFGEDNPKVFFDWLHSVCVYNNNFIETKTSPSTPGVYSGNNTISLLQCRNISKRLKHKKKD